ncbi:MAG TPA: hypothetical protein VFH77_06790 [Streptomyces sp.]|jgi:hypothetical protein|nr:hypothetical protein [Streptomyces sp.]
MSDGIWAFVMAVIVVLAVAALIQKDGRRTRSRGGPSGWGGTFDGGFDGGGFGGHHHDAGGGSDGGGGGDGGGA